MLMFIDRWGGEQRSRVSYRTKLKSISVNKHIFMTFIHYWVRLNLFWGSAFPSGLNHWCDWHVLTGSGSTMRLSEQHSWDDQPHLFGAASSSSSPTSSSSSSSAAVPASSWIYPEKTVGSKTLPSVPFPHGWREGGRQTSSSTSVGAECSCSKLQQQASVTHLWLENTRSCQACQSFLCAYFVVRWNWLSMATPPTCL